MVHTKLDQLASIKTKLQPVPQIRSKIGLPEIVEPVVDIYDGPTTVIPSSFTDQELQTNEKYMKSDITVKQIPYYETSNEYGKTVYIGNEDLIIFEGGN